MESTINGLPLQAIISSIFFVLVIPAFVVYFILSSNFLNRDEQLENILERTDIPVKNVFTIIEMEVKTTIHDDSFEDMIYDNLLGFIKYFISESPFEGLIDNSRILIHEHIRSKKICVPVVLSMYSSLLSSYNPNEEAEIMIRKSFSDMSTRLSCITEYIRYNVEAITDANEPFPSPETFNDEDYFNVLNHYPYINMIRIDASHYSFSEAYRRYTSGNNNFGSSNSSRTYSNIHEDPAKSVEILDSYSTKVREIEDLDIYIEQNVIEEKEEKEIKRKIFIL